MTSNHSLDEQGCTKSVVMWNARQEEATLQSLMSSLRPVALSLTSCDATLDPLAQGTTLLPPTLNFTWRDQYNDGLGVARQEQGKGTLLISIFSHLKCWHMLQKVCVGLQTPARRVALASMALSLFVSFCGSSISSFVHQQLCIACLRLSSRSDRLFWGAGGMHRGRRGTRKKGRSLQRGFGWHHLG